MPAGLLEPGFNEVGEVDGGLTVDVDLVALEDFRPDDMSGGIPVLNLVEHRDDPREFRETAREEVIDEVFALGLRDVAEDASFDRTTVDAIGKLLRLTVIITAALVILQTLGYSISGVLAFGGVGGIAVGFAAKDLLANFFGSVSTAPNRTSGTRWRRGASR